MPWREICALLGFVAGASAKLDGTCRLNASRSLLQTHTQKIFPSLHLPILSESTRQHKSGPKAILNHSLPNSAERGRLQQRQNTSRRYSVHDQTHEKKKKQQPDVSKKERKADAKSEEKQQLKEPFTSKDPNGKTGADEKKIYADEKKQFKESFVAEDPDEKNESYGSNDSYVAYDHEDKEDNDSEEEDDSMDDAHSMDAEDADPGDAAARADAELQAPPEGGAFSMFFNNRSKGPGIQKWLQYFPAYQRHFAQFVGKEVHLVEIGIQSGGSLAMWKSIFGEKAHIYGIDIDPACKAYEDDQIKIFIGDQEDVDFWDNFKREVPRVDIMIDDGGHMVEQMVATMGEMLPHVSANGVYIIEDIHEDMHDSNIGVDGHDYSDHKFWGFQLDLLVSPAGKNYTGLGQYVSSVHSYPYLVVAELRNNTGAEAMNRQLGTGLTGQPEVARMIVADTMDVATPISNRTLDHLHAAFPWLEWEESGVLALDVGVDYEIDAMPDNGWLIIRDPKEEFTFDAPWDWECDAFMQKVNARFIALHRGLCCDPTPNTMQKRVNSYHLYPHLLIAQTQMFGGDEWLHAPRHGTQWHPYRDKSER